MKASPSTVRDRLTSVRFRGSHCQPPNDAEINALPTPEPSSQVLYDCVGEESTDSNDDEVLPPAAKRRKVSIGSAEHSGPKARIAKQIDSKVATKHGNTAMEGSAETPAKQVPRSSSRLRAKTSTDSSSLPFAQESAGIRIGTKFPTIGSAETTEDEDVIAPSRLQGGSKERKKARPTQDRWIVADNGPNTIAAESGEATSVSSEDGDKPTRSDKKSRRLRSKREYQEMKEELEDLQDYDVSQPYSSGTHGSVAEKARQRRKFHLDLLKRRRAGEKGLRESHDSSDGSSNSFENAARSTKDIFANLHDNVDGANVDPGSTEEEGIQADSELDVSDKDFVVSDDDIGVPSGSPDRPHSDIPIEFTSYASATPRELFVFVIDWLVKNMTAPAFSRHDQLWKLAFSKVEMEMTAQADSRLLSSAWNGAFTVALNARPELKVGYLHQDDRQGYSCDACNRSNHPAQYDFVFSGSAYHRDTLEPIRPGSTGLGGQKNGDANVDKDGKPESSDDGEQSDDAASVDSRGQLVPSSDTHFRLGRYCANNAELAHRFTHWKHHLNEQVIHYLESQGALPDETREKRQKAVSGSSSRKKRKSQEKWEHEAETLVDRMQADGIIEEMWRRTRRDLDDARMGMEGFARKGNRGTLRIGSVMKTVPAWDAAGDAVDGSDE